MERSQRSLDGARDDKKGLGMTWEKDREDFIWIFVFLPQKDVEPVLYFLRFLRFIRNGICLTHWLLAVCAYVLGKEVLWVIN